MFIILYAHVRAGLCCSRQLWWYCMTRFVSITNKPWNFELFIFLWRIIWTSPLELLVLARIKEWTMVEELFYQQKTLNSIQCSDKCGKSVLCQTLQVQVTSGIHKIQSSDCPWLNIIMSPPIKWGVILFLAPLSVRPYVCPSYLYILNPYWNLQMTLHKWQVRWVDL